MPVKGPIEKLAADAAKLRAIVNAKFANELRIALKKAASKLVIEGWDSKRSPSDKPWDRGKSGGGGLKKTGAMRAALKIEDRPDGFAIVDAVKAKSGAYYSGLHAYGGTIRAHGVIPITQKVRLESGRLSKRIVPGRNKIRSGAKPMTWRTPDGKWHRAYLVKIPARPFIPQKNSLPPKWGAEFIKCFNQVIKAYTD